MYVEGQKKQSFNYAKSVNTIEEYQRFLDKYNDSKYRDSCHIKMSILYESELYQCRTVRDYEIFVDRYEIGFPPYWGSSKFLRSAEKRIIEMKDSIQYMGLKNQIREKLLEPILLLQNFITENPKSNYLDSCKVLIKDIYQMELDKSYDDVVMLSAYIEKYKKSIFDREYKGKYIDMAQARMESLEWITDEDAWRTAKKNSDIISFRKYMSLYPNGKYYNEANKIIIDLEVDNVFHGSYGKLPKMDRRGSNRESSRNIISVENSTSYTLTLLYSGPESKRLIIRPLVTQSITLINGNYRIAAFVNANHVRSFAGNEYLTGGNYHVSYYIKTSYW